MIRRSIWLLAFISAVAVAADARTYNFDLTVRTVDGHLQHVVEALPAGTYKEVDVSPTLKFDLVTPADGKSPTIVRLIDTSGPEPRVLHTAQRGDSAEVPRLSAYTICKEGVHFQSPTPEVLTTKCRD